MSGPTREQVVKWKELAGGYDEHTEPPTCWDAGDIIFSPEQMHYFADLAYAAGQASKVPEGWKLVPVEPTRQMLDAAHVNFRKDVEIDPLLKTSYRAMLSAAPSQEGGAA